MKQVAAACLCGKVRVTAKSMSTHIGTCHCSMCRKWGGGPLMVAECGTNITFTNEEFVKVYNSSDWAERGFCSQCGSHLSYRLKESKQHFVPVGLFDNFDQYIFDHQVFIDHKPDYYSFANKTKNMTEAEVFSQFTASSE